MGLNKGWLNTQLETMGIPIENIFLAQVDTTGELYLEKLMKKLKPYLLR